jgi:HAD superfamily hydrolase (TIGR01450 family)
VTTRLLGSDVPLSQRYDVALLDLDGVVYIGPQAVDGAPQALERARQHGMRLAYVTNNAARPATAVAEHLTALGIPAQSGEVITSAQAAAHVLAEEVPPGAKILVLGAAGLREALVERGLVPVSSADDGPVAVVQGYSPELSWADLAEGAVAIGRGLPWIASNLDRTIPSARGPLPGNGSMVAALRHATGVTPRSTGKPDPAMHRESVERSGASNPIVVGDRLDTDIEGATAVGCASLLVMTGVTVARDLLGAPPAHRPDYLAADLTGLLYPHPEVTWHGAAECGQWLASVDEDGVILLAEHGLGVDAQSGMDALRAVCVAAWHAADAGLAGSRHVSVRPATDSARDVVAELGISEYA